MVGPPCHIITWLPYDLISSGEDVGPNSERPGQWPGLDTGEAASIHPDLLGRTLGFFFYGTLEDASDEHGHGTHVSGTVAAKFGGGRVVGVAPDACVAAYKVFDRFRYTDANNNLVDGVGAFDGPIFTAIIDAVLSGYKVISMSLGGALDRNNKSDNASWLAWDRVAKFANRNGVVIVAAQDRQRALVPGGTAVGRAELRLRRVPDVVRRRDDLP